MAAPTIDDATELGETRTTGAGSSSSGAEHPVVTGDSIGRYVVVGPLGVGGMGVVLAAYDPELDRKVAIKLLHAVADSRSEATVRARLLREAQAIAKLAHPNVVAVHDVGVHEPDPDSGSPGRVFVAMEFVDGGTLGDWMAAEARTWRAVVRLFIEAGRGLAAAHAAGVVHRDFKPANVLLGKDGRPRVADFGIARNTAEPSSEREPAHDGALELDDDELVTGNEETTAGGVDRALSEDATTGPLTQTGMFLGTPAYMAPEQFKGARVDAQADQFGFCVALYEALYGERPFAGKTVQTLYFEVSAGRVRDPVRGREVPAWLRRILLRGLSADPEQRWPDMPTLLDALRPRRRSNRMLASVAMLGLAVVAGGTAIALDRPVEPSPVCTEAQAELHESWSPSLRAAIEGQVTKVDASVGAELLAGLDAWANSWTAAWTDACEASLVHRVQSDALLDRRMSCLARERRRVGAYAELLREADDTLIHNAMVGLETLAQPTRCSDAEALMAAVAAPEDPQLREQVEQLSGQLDQVYASLTAGEWTKAKAALEPLEARVAEAGWRPLAAEFAFLQGWQQRGTDALAPSEAAYRRAHVDAVAVGDEHLAAEALRDLAELIAEWESRHDEALEHLRVAEAHAEHLDDDDLRASVELVRATVLEQRGDFETALAAALRSSEAAARVHGQGSAKVAEARYRESMIAYRLGRIDAAKTSLAAAREGWGEHHGPTHPITLELVNAAGVLAGATGDWGQAEIQFGLLADRQEMIFGPDHLEVSDALSNLGGAQYNNGHPEAALRSHERALAIREREMGPDNLYVGHTLANLAVVHARLHRYDEAKATAQRALGIIEAVRGPRHHDTMIAHSLIGEVALVAGDDQGAYEAFSAALELASDREIGSPLQRYEFGLQVSLCLVHLDRLGAASKQLDLADEQIGDAEVVDLDLLVHDYLRARIAAQSGDLEGARELAQAAMTRVTASEGDGVDSVAEARRWLQAFQSQR